MKYKLYGFNLKNYNLQWHIGEYYGYKTAGSERPYKQDLHKKK